MLEICHNQICIDIGTVYRIPIVAKVCSVFGNCHSQISIDMGTAYRIEIVVKVWQCSGIVKARYV